GGCLNLAPVASLAGIGTIRVASRADLLGRLPRDSAELHAAGGGFWLHPAACAERFQKDKRLTHFSGSWIVRPSSCCDAPGVGNPGSPIQAGSGSRLACARTLLGIRHPPFKLPHRSISVGKGIV